MGRILAGIETESARYLGGDRQADAPYLNNFCLSLEFINNCEIIAFHPGSLRATFSGAKYIPAIKRVISVHTTFCRVNYIEISIRKTRLFITNTAIINVLFLRWENKGFDQ